MRPAAPAWTAFEEQARALNFSMNSEEATGQLLTTLAASKPGGRFLELGTGVGLGSARLLAGMDDHSTLDTVEMDEQLSGAAQRFLAQDARVTFHVSEGSAWISGHAAQRYDFIFADTWPGKFSDLEATLALLAPGGIYFIDDLFPQPNWPEGHQVKVDTLRQTLENRSDLHCTALEWASGLMICVKKGERE